MKKPIRTPGDHVWRFFRAGGFDQVRLDTAQDLMALDQLDQKLWLALACPVDNVYFDARTLSLIDTDGDRRIRAVELIAAIKWAAGLLRNPEDLVAGGDGISLQSIQDSGDEGKALSTALRSALRAMGKEESGTVTLADAQALEKVLSGKPYNGDGIITEDSAQDDTSKSVIRDLIGTMGSVADRSGKPGINAEKVEAFFKQASDFDLWMREAERTPNVRPLGDATADAAAAILAVKDKVNDYFIRCAVAEFDASASAPLNAAEKEYSAISGNLLSSQSAELARLPLARIEPRRPLPLTRDLNPAWAAAMGRLQSEVVRPCVGTKESLTESDWKALTSVFTLWYAWQERKPATSVDTLGIDKIRAVLAGDARERILALIEQDKAEAATFAALVSLEKLIRYRRDLHRLCTNFVNFKDFYAKGGPAIFQAGTLYLDQRSCNLCIKVDDVNKHSCMAAMAGTHLVYCECKRKGATEKMSIVAAFTNGDSDNLIVGRNGVFYDRENRDWDATIVKIIENPISIREAFWLPYKGLVRMIESQVAKRAAAADAQSSAKLSQAAVVTANVDKAVPDQPAPPKKLDIGIVAALGVAAGALGTFVATLLGYASGIFRLGPLAIAGALVGVLLLISGPSVILAYIKLRKRNLGPILDAGGWAVNAKACINVPFGAVLTHVATLPPGAQRDLVDPYAEKKSPWPKIIVFALVLYIVYAALNHLGFVNEWTGGRMGAKNERAKSVSIEKTSQDVPAPASQP